MQLTNEWISGFVDGEGCFKIQKINKKKNKEDLLSFQKHTKTKSTEILIKETKKKTPSVIDYTVYSHRFLVSLDKKSLDVLYGLKRKFKCGTVHKGEGNMMTFQVSKTVHLNNIIVPFFQKYKLLTKKGDSFYSFVKSLENYNEKNQISLNKKDQIRFIKKENVVQAPSKERFDRGSKENKSMQSQAPHRRILDKGVIFSKETFEQPGYNFSDNWFRGFIDAQGCFTVSLVKDCPLPQLVIKLDKKDKQIGVFLQQFLKCGTLIKRKDGSFILQIIRIKDYERYIFPKLQTKGSAVLLRTIKRISYQKFRKIVRLICEKKDQTIEGLEKIKKLITALNKENDYLSITKAEREFSIKKFQDCIID